MVDIYDSNIGIIEVRVEDNQIVAESNCMINKFTTERQLHAFLEKNKARFVKEKE